MMLSSTPMKADEALKLGLVDAVVTTNMELLPAAKRVALEIADGKRPKIQTLHRCGSRFVATIGLVFWYLCAYFCRGVDAHSELFYRICWYAFVLGLVAVTVF